MPPLETEQTLEVGLHEAQDRFCESPALYRGFVGGRGAGKTWVGAFDLMCRAREGHTYLIASPTGVLMQDTTFPTFRKLAQELGVWWDCKLTPYPNVTIAPGAVVRFRTAEDPERLRGPNLSGAWLDEASLMTVEAYNVVIACLRERGEQGWLSATFTPRGTGHWTYDVFGGSRPDTFLIHSDTRANPFNPPGFRDTLARQYSPLRARQELGGEFVSMEGAEWPPDYFTDRVIVPACRWPASWKCCALALDPALGEGERGKPPPSGKPPKPGCYAAFCFVGVDTEGVLWADAWMSQQWDAAALVAQGIHLWKQTGAQALSVEVNGGQAFLAELFRAEARRQNITLPLYAINQLEDKEVRIRQTLTPFLAQGRLRFREDSPGAKLLLGQMRDFPVGEFKDGPDALQMAVVMCDWLLGHKPRGAQPRAVR